ncbi:MAG TPA: DUF3419 family protein [Polyangiaceae bacterium]|nr:DUF3419 family protein [Polyangiaceae bacterium]
MLALAPTGVGNSIVHDGPVVWNKESILFSACNEDTRSELDAFGSLEGKRVFCVTAGGGRVLGLLPARPKEIVCCDLNPAQSALLELKVAAMRDLPHDGYLKFLGVRADLGRLATYERLRPRLSAGAKTFFDRNPDLLEEGILYQGKLERYLRGVSIAMNFARPLGVRRMLEAPTLDTQRAFLKKIQNPLWRTVAETMCRRSVLRAFSGDPGFFQYLPQELPLHRELYRRIHDYLRDNLLRENSLLQIVFFGRYVWEPGLPVYLNVKTYDAARAALSEARIEIRTAMVDAALESEKRGRFDAYSLSDISSYLDDGAHHRLFESVMSSAAPGARLVSRSNIHHRPLATEHSARLTRDRVLERALSARDHSCVHEFVVGTVDLG